MRKMFILFVIPTTTRTTVVPPTPNITNARIPSSSSSMVNNVTNYSVVPTTASASSQLPSHSSKASPSKRTPSVSAYTCVSGIRREEGWKEVSAKKGPANM